MKRTILTLLATATLSHAQLIPIAGEEDEQIQTELDAQEAVRQDELIRLQAQIDKSYRIHYVLDGNRTYRIVQAKSATRARKVVKDAYPEASVIRIVFVRVRS
jgi:uncharacterized Fe-S cluster-containing protein